MLQKGDRFIHYGRRKVVKGVVERVTEKHSFDLINGVKTVSLIIVSQTGERFDSSDCKKISGDILPSFIKKLKNLSRKL